MKALQTLKLNACFLLVNRGAAPRYIAAHHHALDAASHIEDLRQPPSNKLEALRGKRLNQWSIRINDQWRICFCFENGQAVNVEIVDYH